MSSKEFISPSIPGGFRISALCLALFATTSVSTLVSAQPENAEGEDSTIVYEASYFTDYNPVSVNDMIDRIPGVTISSNTGGGRGLGSGGDLLINGQRLAGKDNSPRDQLSRIAAREVERIEIIRDTSGELAVRGSGQVVNIVLQNTGTRASTSIEVNSDLHQDGTVQPGASISHSRQNGGLSMMFNLLADPKYSYQEGTEYSTDAALNPTQTMEQFYTRDRMNYQTSTTIGYRVDQHRMQVNALYGMSDHPVDLERHFYQPDMPTTLARMEHETNEYEQNNWELGGDYEYSFANGSRALMLFVVNDQTNDRIFERFNNSTPTTSAEEEKVMFIDSDQRTRERIVQGNYNWSLSDYQDMQLGLERAQTILDTKLLLGKNSGEETPSPEYGGLHPALSSSNLGTTVEEMRYEGFAVHNWTLNDRMTLESSLEYETSEITQTGQTAMAREFSFWKPSIDYRFNITSDLQLRATVQRQVQQLSFDNFSASANTSDADRDTDAGNPELVPTKETRYELTLEYRLPEDAGVVSSRFFFRDLTDQIGLIDATVDPQSPLSASGNIGDAERWGVYLDGSTRLGAFGVPDALISSSLYLFDSAVTNPLLGSTERINGRGRFSLGFRHDITDWNLNYGFDYQKPFNGGMKEIEVSYIDWDRDPTSLTMFVSTVLFDDVTFRLESNNTLDDDNCRYRQRYNGHVSSGDISEIENFCWGAGQKVALKVRTTF